MHQIRSEYLDAILQYIARKPYNEVHQLIAMISSANPVPPKPPEPAQSNPVMDMQEAKAEHEVMEEQKPEDLINDNKEG